MNASTFFIWAGSLTGQTGREDAVGLQAEAQPFAVLAERRVEPAQLLHALEPVGDRVAVHEQRAGGRPGGPVVLEERLERDDELGAVGLVVADQRRDGVLVER